MISRAVTITIDATLFVGRVGPLLRSRVQRETCRAPNAPAFRLHRLAYRSSSIVQAVWTAKRGHQKWDTLNSRAQAHHLKVEASFSPHLLRHHSHKFFQRRRLFGCEGFDRRGLGREADGRLLQPWVSCANQAGQMHQFLRRKFDRTGEIEQGPRFGSAFAPHELPGRPPVRRWRVLPESRRTNVVSVSATRRVGPGLPAPWLTLRVPVRLLRLGRLGQRPEFAAVNCLRPNGPSEVGPLGFAAKVS